jgi:hypothetical protein
MPGSPVRRTRLTAVAAVSAASVVAAAALAGCSSKDHATGTASSAGGPSAQHAARGLTVSGQWPLTGETAHGNPPHHPVMIVKIDNTASSSPQIGLGHADLVTEELVEGGSTRLAVFFYQHTPHRVGPVRSMRATDIGIVKPAKAVLVASGGAPPTLRRIRAAHIPIYTEGAPGFARDSSRPAPYNLFDDLHELAGTVHGTGPGESYLPFGTAKDLPKGKPAAGLAATFSGGHTTQWVYRGGTYVNENSYAAPGDRFRPDNVLVLRVRVGDAGYLDPAGNHVPETHFTGTGKALLFHGGRVVAGTWKKTLTSTVSLHTTTGAPLDVPAGHTWIELVPANGGSVTVRR